MKFCENGVIHFASKKDIEILKWKFAALTVEGDKIVWVLPKWIEVMENSIHETY